MPKFREDPEYLTASLVTAYTVPASRQATLVEIVLHNNDSVARRATVHFIPSGGSALDSNKVIGHATGNAMDPGETQIYRLNPMLGAGDFVQWSADVTDKISAYIAGIEEIP